MKRAEVMMHKSLTMSALIRSFSIRSASFFCSLSVLVCQVAMALDNFWIFPAMDLWNSLKSLACWRMLFRYSYIKKKTDVCTMVLVFQKWVWWHGVVEDVTGLRRHTTRLSFLSSIGSCRLSYMRLKTRIEQQEQSLVSRSYPLFSVQLKIQ